MLLRFLLVFMLATGVVTTVSAASVDDVDLDQVKKVLAHTGIDLNGELVAPEGFRGFLGQYQGQQIPVYVTPDAEHLVIGSIYDMEGNDLTMSALRDAADARFGEKEWKMLQNSTWISEGEKDSKRVVYAFMDTECPFCHQFWEASQDYLKKGGVEVRHILVAVISPKSLPRGAAVLDADDQTAAWLANERSFGKDHPMPKDDPSSKAKKQLDDNAKLMNKLGFFGTPAIIYKDDSGKIHSLTGMPRDEASLKAIFEG